MIQKIRAALAHGFHPRQIANRALFEVGSRFPGDHCWHRPTWLHFYVSSRCNFRCRFCTNHGSGKGRVEMAFHPPAADLKLSVVEKILDAWPEAMVCTFCGVGEPFLNHDLLSMVRHAVSRRMITDVVTNGSCLDKWTIPQILDSGLHRLTVSLVEADATSHRESTGVARPGFHRIVDGVRTLRAARDRMGRSTPSIRISRVLTQSSRALGYDFIELGLDLGVDEVLLNNLILAGIDGFGPNECLRDTPDNREFFHEMRTRYRRHRFSVLTPILLKPAASHRCEWYWRNLSIDALGNVSGCGRFITPKAEFGSVLEGDPWNGPHFREMRRRFLNGGLPGCCLDCVETSR